MAEAKIQIIPLEELAKNLAAFAIDRTDLKALLAAIPQNSGLNTTTIEYELQILKILSVGWSIAFYMPPDDKHKGPLAEQFWINIRDIAQKISTLTATTSGTQIDYFEVIKDRLNTYLKVMKNLPKTVENPAGAMGPAFAVACNHAGDAITVLTGTKMFALTLGAVQEYLNAVQIDDIKLN
ncbi:MAG: hypothetical protein ABIJ31_02480 [Pseudomonadota bacterium]